MKSFFDIPDHITDFVEQTVVSDNKSSIEKALLYFQENGISQMQSVYILNTLCDIPFSKANLYVMSSKAWSGK